MSDTTPDPAVLGEGPEEDSPLRSTGVGVLLLYSALVTQKCFRETTHNLCSSRKPSHCKQGSSQPNPDAQRIMAMASYRKSRPLWGETPRWYNTQLRVQRWKIRRRGSFWHILSHSVHNFQIESSFFPSRAPGAAWLISAKPAQDLGRVKMALWKSLK